ncbi:hypothetical protein Mapa_016347 [Marchantia paleacea]|nr:hypothetical protein Mapa_016347 [Marchantia paleacea]
MAGSRLVCRGCTLSNHFSCSICNAYFRDNVHATTCYAPWRPWGSHVSAAPVLTRYTVVKSMGALPAAAAASMRTRAARDGFVKNGVPFMITNELTLTPLTTRSIAKFLKTLNDQDGETESPDCHELMIGKTEVVLLLGAAMTSLTPLTDVFAKMCNSENKISGSSTFSEGLPSLSGGQFPQRTDNKQVATETGSRLPSMAKPLVDLMTYVRPLASGFADALQQGTAAAVHGVSTEAQHREVELEGAALDQESLNAVEDKSPAAARRKKTRAPSSSSPVATTQAVDREVILRQFCL